MLMSEERKRYLKRLNKEKYIVTGCRLLILVIFILGWELLAKYNLINTFTFSSPSMILKTFGGLVSDGELLRHLGVTLYEVFISFLLSSMIGVMIATTLWLKPLISKIIDPYLTILNSLPKVALGPLIIIWVGASINSIIFMSLLISTFITIINVYNGFANTDKSYITLMKSFGAKKWTIFRKVVFPSNLDILINSLKINISMNLIGLLSPVGEKLFLVNIVIDINFVIINYNFVY